MRNPDGEKTMKKRLPAAVILFFIFNSLILYADTVKGRILQSNGSPVSGARVTFYSRQPQFKTSANTGTTGHFTIKGIPSGYYNIEIAAKGFCMEYVTRFEVNESKYGVSSPDFTVYKPGSVSGYVYDENGSPLRKIKVNNTATDKNGFYKIWWVRPGESTVAASAQNYVKTSKRVRVEEKKNTGGVNFTLQAGGSVSGRVLSEETGKPLKNARINIWGRDYSHSKTGSAGNFIIEGLPEGSYSVGIYLQGYAHISRDNIKIVKNETSVLPDIKLALRPEYFNLYDRNWTFTPQEEVFLLYNSFRVKKCSVSIVKIDAEKEIQKLAGKHMRIRDMAKHVDFADYPTTYEKEHEIKYPHPLSDIYNRKIDIGPLPLGVYAAAVKPENLPEQHHLFAVTDLAVVSRTAEEKTILYACDILTGAPIEGVKISLLDNLAVKEEGHTGKNGLYETSAAYQKLTAVKEDSFAYLSGSSPHGSGEKRLKSYIYTDRPVYRPEQTVHFKGIIREEQDNSYGVIAGKKSADITVKDPQGNNFHKTSADINPSGSFFGSFTLPEEPPLGSYRIHFEEDFCTFKVLEYRKPEYSVEVTTDKNLYLPSEKISALVRARYYFGAPLKQAEVKYSVYRRDIHRSRYDEDAEYYRDGWGYGMQVLAGEMLTDDNGEARMEIPLKGSYDREAVYTIEARVVDSSRREVAAHGNTRVVPGTFRISIHTEKHLYGPGEEIPVSIYAADYENRPVAGVRLELSAGLEVYEKNRRFFDEIMSRSISTDDKGIIKTAIKTEKAGYFKIYARGKDGRGNLIEGTRSIWITGRSHTTSWTGRRQLEIILDRDIYREGDTVKALINSSQADIPLLLSVERSKVYSREILYLDGHTGVFEFKVEKEHIPTAYITASGVRDKKYYTASRAVNISPYKHLLDIEVKSDREKYRPGENVLYKISTKDAEGRPVAAEISFGLVDESIYAISSELVPRIEDFFYGKKPNRVGSAYSFYEWLYAGAGKDGIGSGLRKDFRDTAYWNPYLLTDSMGSATLKVTLPDNLTTWRSTVRGITSHTLAGTDVQKITASKPLMARLITPRFFVEGDRVFITGIVHNYTEENIPLRIELSASGIDILDSPHKDGTADAGGELKVDWQVKAQDSEKAVIAIKTLSGVLQDGMEITIPVLPYGQEVFKSVSGEVDAFASDIFPVPSSAIPRTLKLSTHIYPSLASGLFRNLDYLAHYPYGCVEQTLSRFMPLMYVAGAVETLGENALSFLAGDAVAFEKMLEKMPSMVNTGLTRLYASQNSDGGWGWWTQDTSRPYISAYVFFGLASARKAGYHVEETRFNRAKDFLKGALKDIKDPDEKTYVLFALAHSGNAQKKHIEDMYRQRDDINAYSLSLLTLVHAIENDTKKARELLDELYARKSQLTQAMSFWKTEKAGYYGWTNSDIEATAWALKATLAVDPGKKEIPGIIRYLLWREKAGFWRSTKDTAICVLAFTDFLKISDELAPEYNIALEVNGEKIADARVTKETLKQFSVSTETPGSFLLPGKENAVALSKKGRGAAYYTHNLTYTTRDAFIEAQDEGFSVKREYLKVRKQADNKGAYKEIYEPLDESVKTGDMLKVKITVTGKEAYRYVMIEDMLPAGCEVADENSGSWHVRREVRDEKAAFFTVLFGSEKQEISYFLRAETPGSYHVLPARASMMYLPEIWGQSSEKTLTITEK